MIPAGSGMPNMSGCAGVISSQVAKPAKPAPSFCISEIAAAGTSLARCPPNRSVNEIMKYRMPRSFAICARSSFMSCASWAIGRSPTFVVLLTLVLAGFRNFLKKSKARSRLNLEVALPWDPTRARKGNTRHGGCLEGQRAQIFRFEVVDVIMSCGSGDRLQLERHDLEIVREA